MWVANTMWEEQMTPAGVKPIVDASMLPTCHPSGAHDMDPLWVCQSILYLLTRNLVYSSPFVTFPLKSELLSGEAFI